MTGPELWIGPADDPDRYQLDRLVGAGAEGLLYRGSITVASGAVLDVAVKMLHPQHRSRINDWRDRWAEQIEVLRSVHSPGLAFVRDGFVGPLAHPRGERPSEDSLFLVMNWVDGVPLDRWLEDHPESSPAERLRLLLPVAAALDALHSGQSTGGVPVIHGDVKPGNILVDDEGRSTLVDFGLVRCLPGGQTSSGVNGTPGYVAPEVITDGLYTPAADRYALGGVAYHLMTGRDLPVRPSQEEVVSLLAGVGDEAAAARVAEMLHPDPARRPTILANWCAQLRNSSLEAEIPTEALPPIAPTRNPRPAQPADAATPRRRIRRPALAVAAAAVLVVAGGLATRSPDPDPVAAVDRSAERTSSTRPRSSTTRSALSTSAPAAETAAPVGQLPTEALGAVICANRLLGYQVELPEGLVAAAESELIGPCEAFGTSVTSDLPMDDGLLTQDLVFTKLDMTVHEFLARAGQPPIESETTVAGHPARVVHQMTTTDLAPSFPSGTYLHMYVVDLGGTTFVAQLAVPPSRRDTFYDLEPLLDRMMVSLSEVPTKCLDSTDPRCGPFYFDPEPAPNQAMVVAVTAEPASPRVGEPVTFTVTVSDPDAPVFESTLVSFGDGPEVLGEVILRSDVLRLVRTRTSGDMSAHGRWTPPAREAGGQPYTFTHTYTSPGDFTARFEFRSSSRNAPLGQDPYASTAKGTVVVSVR